MCLNCWKERMPDRGSTCLEGGVYLLNYAGCFKCKSRGSVKERDKDQTEEENGDENISFTHACKDCGHVIATHTYEFSIVDEYQEYTMECNLCGHGEATVSVLPDDPREKELF